MSSREPATVAASLHELARHGGLTGPHRDGWGVAFYEGVDVRLIKEPTSAADSECVRFVERQGFASDLVVSHVRKATRGGRALENTQPFVRELGGRVHVFAHNGNLLGIDQHPDLRLGTFRPVGTTDSELAFCALLGRLQRPWLRDPAPPSLDERFGLVADFARGIAELGPANFIYTDGELLFAHANRRTQPGGEMRPPGLHVSLRSCPLGATARSSDGDTSGTQQVVLFASVPLTPHGWIPMAKGEVIAAASGRVVRTTGGAPFVAAECE